MTDIQLLAFVVVPLTVLALGWGLALWAGRAPRRPAPGK
jgi:hypothetical protein